MAKRTQAELLRDAKASLLKTRKSMRASQQQHAIPARASGNWMQKTQERRKAAEATLSRPSPTKKTGVLFRTDVAQKGLHKAGIRGAIKTDAEKRAARKAK